ncbi:phosphoglycerate mutase [Lysobacter silvisoli]|uniref:Phosphoglycerate mutase n=1 Tax=Lysobacter silvisoli TaxID=2293254 RepID=A0A371K459_9GAMM|nr:phosphoglycerate mutase [Lysobacter silvisoli]RDZ28637.1 phosphoglycerate mutase [Lysobacter silvisoli]
MGAPHVTLLLPERERYGGQRLSEDLGRRLARADRSQRTGDALARVLDVLPRGWPVAAATRQRDAGDAAHAAWLRADPAYVRPDINGARLLAYGQALHLDAAEAAEFVRPLKPLFGDAGFPIDAPAPSRWYLRLPAGARLPAFDSPETALGADLFEHLPDAADASAEGRRWRALLSEAQVLLHNHPRNAQRIAAGLAPVNSLWFWGAGVLPDHVRSDYARICSDDEALTALGALAGAAVAGLPPRWAAGEGSTAIDLRRSRDLDALQRDWLAPLCAQLDAGELARIELDFADGSAYALARGQGWRFWRRPLRSPQP